MLPVIGEAKIAPSIARRRELLDYFFQIGDFRVVVACPSFQQGKVVEGARVIRAQSQGAHDAGAGRVVFLPLNLGQADIRIGIGIIGP